MRIGIGIDTGGTYTDAVAFDFEAKQILGAAKALTTNEDLSIGILEALDALPSERVQAAEVISLSTTLATNACVEDKGGSAKLAFFGGDARVIDRLGAKYGLPPANEIYLQESFTKFSGAIEREPDWDLFSARIDTDFQGFDGVGIIEMNAMKNSAVVEKQAKELFLEKMDVPVVCGHELFNELNCLQRGSSTLLNARLIPVIKAFMDAIKTAIRKRGIKASVVIVRSDGSLMSEGFAQVRPIETLLCGPAASVLGSAYSTHEENSIVVDMGGTTTDIGFIKGGSPYKVTDGISVGRWKTFVDGLYIKTFGLGGDTAVHYAYNELFLEDYRVVPLCIAAEKHPRILENLKKLEAEGKKYPRPAHEHFLLARDISGNLRYSDEERELCAALKDSPLSFAEAAQVMGRDIYNFKIPRLIKEGVVQACGLTPTDIMHIRGDFGGFSQEASLAGARFVAAQVDSTVDELCECVYDEAKRRLYVNIVKAMLETSDKHYAVNGFTVEAERFINAAYDHARSRLAQAGGAAPGLVSSEFSTGYVLAGVGAPIRLFLDDVATMLGTRAVYPEHYEVANALGSIVGNIHAVCEVEVKPKLADAGQSGYIVFGNTETRVFDKLEDAEAFATDEARAAAHAEALRRGAGGEVVVSCDLERREVAAKDSIVYLGTKATAHGIGSMGF